MAAPYVGDWSITSPAGTYSFNRLNPIPGPATKWGGRIRLNAGGTWANTIVQAATPISNTATTGQTYGAQIAWFDNAGAQLSPWSDYKTVLIT